MKMPLSQLRDLLEGVPAELECSVGAITQDSRAVVPGGLFLARSGFNRHGLDFLDEVLAQGAVAVLAEPDQRWPQERIEGLAHERQLTLLPVANLGHRASAIAGAFYGNPSAALRVIGITGTNGKTSCALALGQVLSQYADTLVIGTLGSGRPQALQPGSHTTPDAVSLQQQLAEFLDESGEVVVMEVSSHALDQGRVEAIHYDTAVFTNLSRDHLDYHKDMDDYGQAKARLFGFAGLGLAVVNADDPFATEVIKRLSSDVRLALHGRQFDAAMRERADRLLQVEEVRTHAGGIAIDLISEGASVRLQSRWLGRFNAENLMAILAVLLEQGLGLERALELLAELPAPPGRMEAISQPGQPLVVVDYAHTPDALEKALQALREHCDGKLVCLFGCGGDRDIGKRPQMGAVAERLADRVMLTDDNPRSEDGDEIIRQILDGTQVPEQINIERDRAQAMRRVITEAAPVDVIAICGKGHETTQTIADEVRPFNDREMAGRLLQEVWPCEA